MIHSGNHEKGQNMQIMRLAAIVLAAVCGIAAAGSKQPETFDVWLRAGVQIDETDHVQDLQWAEPSKVHAVIAERLAPVVRSWECERATANGQPAPRSEGHTSELQSRKFFPSCHLPSRPLSRPGEGI